MYLQHPYYDQRDHKTIKRSASIEEECRQHVDDNCKDAEPKEDEYYSKYEFTMTPTKRSKLGKWFAFESKVV